VLQVQHDTLCGVHVQRIGWQQVQLGFSAGQHVSVLQ
jgi:hypothetical protein